MNIGIRSQDNQYCSDIINQKIKGGKYINLEYELGNWVANLKPSIFLTVTAREITKDHGFSDKKWLYQTTELCENLRRLFHWVQVDLFGRAYLKQCRYLKGIGCFERQANYQPHLHAVVNVPEVCSIRDFRGSLVSKAAKIPMFFRSGINVQAVNQNKKSYMRLGAYIGKSMDYDSGLITISGGELG